MRTLVRSTVLSALFIAGCVGLRHGYFTPETGLWWSESILKTNYCYSTKHGIDVYAYPGRCPNQKQIEEETGELLDRMGAPAHAFTELKAHFVREWIDKDGKYPWSFSGMAPYDGLIVVVLEGSWTSWMDTYTHELGHQLLYRAGLPVGDLHAAYNCDYHLKLGVEHVDACYLLPVAVDLNNRTELGEDNFYRQAFSEIPEQHD